MPQRTRLAVVDHFYVAPFSALEQTPCALVTCDSKWATGFYSTLLTTSTEVVYLQHCLVVTWLVLHETADILAHSVYTIRLCTISWHFMHSHMRRVPACLVVTCHLHFRQNDHNLLRATVVTLGWNGYQTKSQHRELVLEKKILLLLLPELEPMTFQSWVWCSNHWAIPTSAVLH